MSDSLTGDSFCFHYEGEDNAIVTLIKDQENDIEISASLYKPTITSDMKTYYFDIEVRSGEETMYIAVSEMIINNTLHSWDQEEHIQWLPGYIVNRLEKNSIAIQLDDKKVAFEVKRVEPNSEHSFYLDFHLIEPRGLSETTTGLVGKFVHAQFGVDETEFPSRLHLHFYNSEVYVTFSVREESRRNPLNGEYQDCWFHKSKEVFHLL